LSNGQIALNRIGIKPKKYYDCWYKRWVCR
jgi:hypothetical protein